MLTPPQGSDLPVALRIGLSVHLDQPLLHHGITSGPLVRHCPQLWLNPQQSYDLDLARQQFGGGTRGDRASRPSRGQRSGGGGHGDARRPTEWSVGR